MNISVNENINDTNQNNLAQVKFHSFINHHIIVGLRELYPIIPESLENKLLGNFIISASEYMFSIYPNGFYLSYEPQKDNPYYHYRYSWAEIILTTSTQFKLAFDSFGVRYNSYDEFARESKPFKDELLYCSFYDAKRQQPYFMRNHAVVDELIESVLGSKKIIDLLDESERDYEELMTEILNRGIANNG